ncbi:ABC transporter ATP-binding protein [Dictyobacter kobayashii]|uniref:ABC transporter n=1 Tax=Dictyobacter kobayashii TaxID=2014872 RepID=A0A402ASJ2_9CHLR|nr:ABC transporter ATP-binding protein [Dictyobacter kobayashii]GCE22076.1 ABC transporter [Dictyobacter kobayashii]
MGFIMDGLEAEAYDRKYTARSLIARIARYFRSSLLLMLAICGLLVIGAGMDAALPFLIARGLDVRSSATEWDVIMLVGGTILATGCISWLCMFVRQWFTARVIGDIVLKVRLDVFQAILKHDLSFFTDHASGRIVSRVTSDTEDFSTVVTLTINLISQLLFILILAAILMVINVHLALIVLAMVPLIILIALSFRRAARNTSQRMQRMQARLNANIQESISGIAIAKNFRQEQAIYAEFQPINAQAFRVGIQQGLLFSCIFPLLLTVAGIGMAVLVYVGGQDVFARALTIGSWLLFVQSVNLFWMPLTSVASFWSQFQQGLAASERVFGLIDAESNLKQSGCASSDGLRGAIDFKDVTFGYSDQKEVLSHFSTTIRAGETVALVGHTGAGKSTLCKLIARFYDFQAGQLQIDGQDIRSFNLQQYRSQLGIVPQVPFLFTGSIADNIRYIRPSASDDQVAVAASQIGQGTWLEALPDGLNTLVEEGGKNLSLGQRQLVALSRVLLQNPTIILLDEATASVDPLTEAQIQEGLDLILADRTAIIIAHRLSTIRHADRILVLSHGQIVQEGTHKDLLQSEGYYQDIYQRYFRHQSPSYEPEKNLVVRL